MTCLTRLRPSRAIGTSGRNPGNAYHDLNNNILFPMFLLQQTIFTFPLPVHALKRIAGQAVAMPENYIMIAPPLIAAQLLAQWFLAIRPPGCQGH